MTIDYGDPRLHARFWAKVYPEPNTGCWLWGNAVNSAGYGVAYVPETKQITLAHRTAYLSLVGPISSGREIDHLCRVATCVNPAHLEVVTPQTNVVRQPRVIDARTRTVCKRGHEMTAENTEWSIPHPDRPRRRCRLCRSIERRQRRVVTRVAGCGLWPVTDTKTQRQAKS